MMASRVTLLLLVTGLFAGMWSGDRVEKDASAELLLARRSIAPQTNFRTVARPVARSLRPAMRGRGEWSVASIPLPPGIAAGTYLVVDGLGRTEMRVVSTRDAFPNGRIERHVAQDQYVVRLDRQRWHFIRMDDADASRAVHQTKPLNRAARVPVAVQR